MLYIGTDIIEISRVRTAAARHPAFYDRILTGREKAYCLEKADPVPTLAGRFAAKEAVIKCLGVGLRGLSWRDFEIIPDDWGAPLVLFSETVKSILDEKAIKSVKVSISHSREYAVAVAVGEGDLK